MYVYTNKFSNVKKTAVAIKEYFNGNIFYYSYFIFLLFLFYPSNKKVIVLFFGFFLIFPLFTQKTDHLSCLYLSVNPVFNSFINSFNSFKGVSTLMPAVSMIQNYIILLNINTCIHVGISWSVKYMKNMVKERQLCCPLSQSWNSFIPELWNDFNNFHQASLDLKWNFV